MVGRKAPVLRGSCVQSADLISGRQIDAGLYMCFFCLCLSASRTAIFSVCTLSARSAGPHLEALTLERAKGSEVRYANTLSRGNTRVDMPE